MFHQAKILVWYKVAGQKVILGEALSHHYQDVISLWVKTPFESSNESHRLAEECGYQVSLFDDGGREIAQKSVSGTTVDKLLFGTRVNA